MGDNTALVGCQCIQARKIHVCFGSTSASPLLGVKSRSYIVSETSKTCATGATNEDESSNPSRFSRKSRAKNGIRFTKNIVSCDIATNRYESGRLLNRLPFACGLGKMGAV
jgi:hypothetical protein